jgi:hypothetical protein
MALRAIVGSGWLTPTPKLCAEKKQNFARAVALALALLRARAREWSQPDNTVVWAWPK